MRIFLVFSTLLTYIHFDRAQKQPSRGDFRKRYSENTLQIYRRTPMPKCKETLLKSHFGIGVLL